MSSTLLQPFVKFRTRANLLQIKCVAHCAIHLRYSRTKRVMIEFCRRNALSETMYFGQREYRKDVAVVTEWNARRFGSFIDCGVEKKTIATLRPRALEIFGLMLRVLEDDDG